MTASANPIRILLIDQHTLVRAALRFLLDNQPGLTVVAEAAPGADALAAAARERPDLIVLDLARASRSCLTLLSELRGAAQDARILVLTDGGDPEASHHAVRLGALGLVDTASPAADLVTAVETVATGEVWLSPTLLAGVLRTMARQGEAKAPTIEETRIATLTARERQVVALSGEGLKNRQMAERLFISEATVRHHLTSIFAKLGVADRLELVRYAYQHGLAQSPCHCRQEASSPTLSSP
jgi:two-component system nitrate/nitrite response regulator NarL